MSSNIKISRLCENCGKSFIAKTTVTRFCSHRCNSQAYKAKERGNKIIASHQEMKNRILAPLEILNAKDYLSINEVCQLLGISRMTLHRQIKARKIKAKRMGKRVIISKKHLEGIFE